MNHFDIFFFKVGPWRAIMVIFKVTMADSVCSWLLMKNNKSITSFTYTGAEAVFSIESIRINLPIGLDKCYITNITLRHNPYFESPPLETAHKMPRWNSKIFKLWYIYLAPVIEFAVIKYIKDICLFVCKMKSYFIEWASHEWRSPRVRIPFF
jgi:hypothetical protein